MKNIPTARIVVACALIANGKRILLQQCLQSHAHAGLWEFPGGKVEPGESPETALCRELAEELGVLVKPGDLVPLAFSSDPDTDIVNRSPYVILLYTCREWAGEPRGREGQEITWVSHDALLDLPLPPLDIPLARTLAAER